MAGTTSLPAKLLIQDIRKGLNGRDLMAKYNITPRQLEKAVEKLVAAKMIQLADLAEQAPVASRIVPIAFKCPACDAPQTRVVEECPQCGVIVEKFLRKQQQRARATPDVTPKSQVGPADPIPAPRTVDDSMSTCPACGKQRPKFESVCPYCSKMMSDEAARRESVKQEVQAAKPVQENLYQGIDAEKHREAARSFLDKTDWTAEIQKDFKKEKGSGAAEGVGGVAADIVLGILFSG